jgi:uncharacterized protein YraI
MKNAFLFLFCSLFFLISCSPSPARQPQPSAVPLVSPTNFPNPTQTPLPVSSNTAPAQETPRPAAETKNLLQVINSEGTVNVRSGPGTYYPVVGKVNNNQQLTVTGTDAQRQWVQFVFPGPADGMAWIYAPFTNFDRASNTLPIITHLPTPPVTPTAEPPRAMDQIKVVYLDGQVNVRAGPGTNFDIVGKVNNGDTLSATGTIDGGDWVQFQYAGGSDGVAWIYAPFTNYDRASSTLPLVEDLPLTPTP